MQTRNLKHTASGAIDMEIEHPVYGWIPFSASSNDSEQHGRDLYAAAMAGDFGAIAAYVAPPPTIPQELTPRQIRLVLNSAGLRQQVETTVAGASQDIRDMWEFSLAYRRDDPTLISMATQIGMTAQQLDDLFTQGAQL